MTASTDSDTTVRVGLDVATTPEHAFEVFTAGFDRWWNRDHHLLSGTLDEVGFEPFVGGAVWERNDAGERCDWGRVLVWDPPRSVAFSWQIGTDWAIPVPDAPGSRVTVTFAPAEGGTRVELVHDRLDVHGEGWESIRDAISREGGWPGLLARFASVAGA